MSNLGMIVTWMLWECNLATEKSKWGWRLNSQVLRKFLRGPPLVHSLLQLSGNGFKASDFRSNAPVLSETILHNYVQTKEEAKDVTRCGDDRGIKYLKTISWWHDEAPARSMRKKLKKKKVENDDLGKRWLFCHMQMHTRLYTLCCYPNPFLSKQNALTLE